MNDKGKTVKSIRHIRPTYRLIDPRKEGYSCIDISMRLELTNEPTGYDGTMLIIQHVTDRVIAAMAEEFLP